LIRVQRYTYPVVGTVGFVLMLWGIIEKQHHYWLRDCGAFILLLNMGSVLPVMRAHARDYLPTMRRLQRLCDLTGVPFGFANAMYRWLCPFIFGTLFLSLASLATGMFLGPTEKFLHYGSYTFEFLCIIGIGIFLTRHRKVESILRKLESAAHSRHLPSSPPRAAKFILLLVPKRHREHLIGDLEEEYTAMLLPEYGVRRARIWYWWQVAISIGPLLWVQIRRGVAIAWLWKRVP